MTSPVHLNKIQISNLIPTNLPASSFPHSLDSNHTGLFVPPDLCSHSSLCPECYSLRDFLTWLGTSHSWSLTLNSIFSERLSPISLTQVKFSVIFCCNILLTFLHSVIAIYNYCNNFKKPFHYLISSPNWKGPCLPCLPLHPRA